MYREKYDNGLRERERGRKKMKVKDIIERGERCYIINMILLFYTNKTIKDYRERRKGAI